MSLVDDYLARTPRSRALFERATASLPGGSTRTTVYSAPYPPYAASGSGLVVTDVDGNTYRDFLGNYTSLILGHAHPAVVAAVEAQIRLGSAFAAPTETEVELAEELRRRLPSIEHLRFTSSGTEATMFAIRAARAFTSRPLIAKFDHSYHGTHDLVMAGTPGVPDAIGDLIVELPWGDPDGILEALRGREGELAAFILEPVQGAGGVRAPEPGFLEFVRSLADRLGALVIFDEIISFRVGPGGAQELFGVRPDLTTLGKIIAGGYPLAAFGGRADVMALLAPVGPVYQAGTLSGNPLAVAAGLATLQHCTAEVYAHVDATAATVARLASDALTAEGVAHRVNRAGSLFSVFFADHAVVDYTTATRQSVARYRAFFHALLARGVYLPPSAYEAWFVSASHDDAALAKVADAMPYAARAAARVSAPDLATPPTSGDRA